MADAIPEFVNDSLDDMARAVGDEIDDALRGRLIDVPLPPGVVGAFEDLHNFADHAAFSVELLRVARQNFGVASVEFIQRMVERRERNEAELLAWLCARRKAYLKFAKGRVRSTSRDLTRFHERFATIYAAAALAIVLGVLPWDLPTLGRTIIACELAHVSSVENPCRLRPRRPGQMTPWSASRLTCAITAGRSST